MFNTFTNQEEILQSNSTTVGYRYLYSDSSIILQDAIGFSIDNNHMPTVELHVYDTSGNIISSDHNASNWQLQPVASGSISQQIKFDLGSEIQRIGFTRGSFKIVINTLRNEVGSYDGDKLFIQEISPSRKELKLQVVDTNVSNLEADIKQFVFDFNLQRNYQYDIVSTSPYSYNDLQSTIVGGQSFKMFSDVTIRDAVNNLTQINLNPIYYSNNGTFIGNLIDYATEISKKDVAIDAWFRGINLKISVSALQQYQDEILNFINTVDLDLCYSVGLSELVANTYPSNYICNFGFDIASNIVNTYYDVDNKILFVKLYDALPNDILENATLWVSTVLVDSIVDSVTIVSQEYVSTGYQLRPPNFDIESLSGQSTGTSYKDWNDLLAANIPTSQQLIDYYFSGSLSGIKLNINYSEFENFIHFSSAEERVKNFRYKLQLIESYSNRLDDLLVVSSSFSGSVDTNIVSLLNLRNTVVSGFDDFERYLFFETSASQLYTFSTASVSPWPKYNTSGSSLIWENIATHWEDLVLLWGAETDGSELDPYWYFLGLYPTDSEVGQAYYTDLVTLAHDYDIQNLHSLIRTVPIHISSDEQNEMYNTFVYMIGHHFDILWAYINHLTKINAREEHPKDGVAQDLIYEIAKSLGFSLVNGRSAKELWEYAFGTDTDGNTMNSGSMASMSSNDTTKEVWRRILNNLPYIYKTKGTARSVKALLSCYGIPSTILAIKEYGGPNNFVHTPKFIHDTYNNSFVSSGSSQYATIQWPRNLITGITPNQFTFRVKPDHTNVYTYGTIENGNTYGLFLATGSEGIFAVTLENVTGTTTEDTVSVTYVMLDSNFTVTVSASVSDYHIFDNEFTTISVEREIETDIDATSNRYKLIVAKNKYGSIVSSSAITEYTTGVLNRVYNSASLVYFGNQPSVGTPEFINYVQEYRIWNEKLSWDALSNQILSPKSYNGNTPTSSYDQLLARYTFGNTNGTLTNTYGTASSCQPNQSYNSLWTSSLIYSSSLVTEFKDMFADTYETSYTDNPSIGGGSIYSEKIRIESSSLSGPLNPLVKMEQSSYDLYSNDSNKLGIYFSPQNAINEDIFNHAGYFDIDDYIGDPRDLYKNNYPSLEKFAYNYWKKYENKNDIPAYLRALMIYDFSFFKTLKQLIPARVNLISGIVIEPNVLERSKATDYIKPTIEDLVHSCSIDLTGECYVISGSYDDLIGIVDISDTTTVISATIPTALTGSVQDFADLGTNTYDIGAFNSDTGQSQLDNIVTTNNTNLFDFGTLYNNTTLSAPWFNVNSNDTVDGGPVVQVWNASQLVINNAPPPLPTQ